MSEKHTCKCTICEEPFTDQSKLDEHQQANHIKCQTCDLLVESQIKLEEHIMNQHSVECPICKTKLKDNNSFASHFNREHIFTCIPCGNVFGSQPVLDKHIKEDHTQDENQVFSWNENKHVANIIISSD